MKGIVSVSLAALATHANIARALSRTAVGMASATLTLGNAIASKIGLGQVVPIGIARMDAPDMANANGPPDSANAHQDGA
jgi:hypothetical protein